MLEAVHTDLVFTISLKRSTQNLQLSTSCRPITPSFGAKRTWPDSHSQGHAHKIGLISTRPNNPEGLAALARHRLFYRDDPLTSVTIPITSSPSRSRRDLSRAEPVGLRPLARAAVERREASAPEALSEWQHSPAWRAPHRRWFARACVNLSAAMRLVDDAPFGASPPSYLAHDLVPKTGTPLFGIVRRGRIWEGLS